MIEALLFLSFILVILYVILWSMLNDDGLKQWWLDFNQAGSLEDDEEEIEKWRPDQ